MRKLLLLALIALALAGSVAATVTFTVGPARADGGGCNNC